MAQARIVFVIIPVQLMVRRPSRLAIHRYALILCGVVTQAIG